MTVLRNPRHESFAQERSKGCSVSEAYATAGYTGTVKGAWRLERLPAVQARVALLQSVAAAPGEVTVERVLRDLGRIAFFDVRRILASPEEDTGAAHGTVAGRTGRGAAGSRTRVVDPSKIDEEAAAAIEEIVELKNGALKVKFYDRLAAFRLLCRYLKMEKPPEEQVPWFIAGEPIEDLDEWVERFAPQEVKDARKLQTTAQDREDQEDQAA